MKKAEVAEILKGSYLCASMTEDEIERLLESSYCRTATFERGARIFHECDRPNAIMLLLRGAILIAKDTLSGKRMILSRIVERGDTFGEVYVYRRVPQYDMYAEALHRSEVLFLDVRLLEEPVSDADQVLADKVMRNQLKMFAAKAYQMNRRLRVLGSASIREKVARLLIERQGDGNRVEVMAREDMADYLNVTRPSLSREISSMVREGIIQSEGRTLIILDQERLEEYV